MLFSSPDKAEAMTDIRVGLTAQYKDKDVITVYNKRIMLGYATESSFVGEEVFYGSSGFSFEPDDSSYTEKSGVYKTYDEARKAMGQNNTSGAIPVLKGPQTWKLYERSDKSTASAREYLIKVSFGKSTFLIDAVEGTQSKKYSPFPQIKAVSSNEDSAGKIISLGSRSYRGRIEIVRWGGKLTAVNIIGIEAYLCGVVTCEMSREYDPEALKAQAVCARSYALYKSTFTCKGTLSAPYNLSDTTASQVYKGVNGESKEAVSAVRATVGEVIYNGQNLVETFYFSTSGGSTEGGIDVWGIKSAVYSSKPDLLELSPEKAPWVITYTLEEAAKLLCDNGFDVGTVRSIKESVVTQTGRVSLLKVTGSGSTKILTIEQAQRVFDLPSAKYKVVPGGTQSEMPYAVNSFVTEKLKSESLYAVSGSGTRTKLDFADQLIVISEDNMMNFPLGSVPKGSVSFFGMGYGHGIGLSQSGANGLAKNGYDYREIIYYYFDNVRIDRY
ncbi:MAG: SpoIID/LytB domain-containing protein [Lachnospiraceae bacterium]|nr:SpoIID/LytB domain-containing protein [Lachnospiraceae bacterium]